MQISVHVRTEEFLTLVAGIVCFHLLKREWRELEPDSCLCCMETGSQCAVWAFCLVLVVCFRDRGLCIPGCLVTHCGAENDSKFPMLILLLQYWDFRLPSLLHWYWGSNESSVCTRWTFSQLCHIYSPQVDSCWTFLSFALWIVLQASFLEYLQGRSQPLVGFLRRAGFGMGERDQSGDFQQPSAPWPYHSLPVAVISSWLWHSFLTDYLVDWHRLPRRIGSQAFFLKWNFCMNLSFYTIQAFWNDWQECFMTFLGPVTTLNLNVHISYAKLPLEFSFNEA